MLQFIEVLLISTVLGACSTLSNVYTDKRIPGLATLWTGLSYLLISLNIIKQS